MTNKVQKLQRACLVKPIKVEVSEKYSTVDTLRQQYLFVPAKYKDCYLAYVINELSGSTFMVSVQDCTIKMLHGTLMLGMCSAGCWPVPVPYATHITVTCS